MIWQFHQSIFTPTAHNETAQNSHVRHPWHCVSTTAHPDVSSQPKEITCSSAPESTIMLNKFPDSSDGVSDLLQNRQGPHALDLFALFVRLVRFHLDSPSLGVHTRIRSTTLDSHVLVCHNAAAPHFDEGNQAFDVLSVHHRSTYRCCCESCRLYHCSCHCGSRNLTVSR